MPGRHLRFERMGGIVMPAGNLTNVFAYEVSPRQGTSFAGGQVRPTPQLQAALDQIFDRSKVALAPVVTLRVDTSTPARTHPVRDAALDLAFSAGPHDDVALTLAAKLADAMDNRSKPSLLMMSVHDGSKPHERRVVIWTFPQQEVFSLRVSRGSASLVLMEAFSRESSLRKIALLEGPNAPTGLLTARVLDFQVTSNDRSVADLWITKFLDARLQMSSAEGTQVLAQALRAAHNRTRGDARSQDQITAAVAALRVAVNPRTSLAQVAATYLGRRAADAFLDSTPPEAQAAVFDVDQTRFDQLVQYRRFILDSGVVVSAPFDELGDGGAVQVSDENGQRRLRVEGSIEDEQVRTRA